MISVIVDGIIISSNNEHPIKEYNSIKIADSGIEMSFNSWHLLKEYELIKVTAKAYDSTLITDEEIVIN